MYRIERAVYLVVLVGALTGSGERPQRTCWSAQLQAADSGSVAAAAPSTLPAVSAHALV
jgi:hypothetical protein